MSNTTLMQGMSGSVPLTNSEQVKNRIADLQTQLQAASPQYDLTLELIHKALKADQETVHLLTEEEIGIICAALAKKKGIVLATDIVAKAGKSKKTIGLEDLM